MSRMDPEDARQGRKGVPVLRILIIALLLCLVAAAGMAVFGSMQPDDDLPAGRVGTGDGEAPAATVQPETAAPATGGGVATPGETGTSPATTPPAN